MINRISVTEVMTFRDCRRLWYWQYYLGYQTKAPIWPLIIGQGVHSCLEAYYKGKNVKDTYDEWLVGVISSLKRDFAETFDRIWSDVISMSTLVDGMIANYVQYEGTHSIGTPVLVEERIYAPILDPRHSSHGPTGAQLSGKIDLVVEREDGLWIVDHKTHVRLPDFRGLDLDEQITGYAYLFYHQTGKFARGLIYNALLKNVPTVPPVIKNGSRLTKAKDMPYTAALYYQEIERNGFNVEDYTEIIDYYESRGWLQFFVREWTSRSQVEVEAYERMIRWTWFEMNQAVDDFDRVFPSGSIHRCATCPFFSVCKAVNTGEDFEYILQSNFIKLDVVEQGNDTNLPLI